VDESEVGPAGQRAGRLGLPRAPGGQTAQAPPAPCAGRSGTTSRVQKKIRPLAQAVATAFPKATVELWATDEHRIGLKPILKQVWCFDGQRPTAPVQHRYDWRYVVGVVHPASGRTIFHLATSVSIALFEVELAAFARQVGASPRKQIVLVLDRAGWHASVKLRVPEHVHLLFPVLLPPYSPELQPAEHLWPLTNTVLANRHFASIDDLEDAQAARCAALQARPDLIRATTRFQWWPRRIRKRQGPRLHEPQRAVAHSKGLARRSSQRSTAPRSTGAVCSERSRLSGGVPRGGSASVTT